MLDLKLLVAFEGSGVRVATTDAQPVKAKPGGALLSQGRHWSELLSTPSTPTLPPNTLTTCQRTNFSTASKTDLNYKQLN